MNKTIQMSILAKIIFCQPQAFPISIFCLLQVLKIHKKKQTLEEEERKKMDCNQSKEDDEIDSVRKGKKVEKGRKKQKEKRIPERVGNIEKEEKSVGSRRKQLSRR